MSTWITDLLEEALAASTIQLAHQHDMTGSKSSVIGADKGESPGVLTANSVFFLLNSFFHFLLETTKFNGNHTGIQLCFCH